VLDDLPDGEICALSEQEEDSTFNGNIEADLNSGFPTILDDIVTQVKLVNISSM
jgi:hypothetical protein